MSGTSVRLLSGAEISRRATETSRAHPDVKEKRVAGGGAGSGVGRRRRTISTTSNSSIRSHGGSTDDHLHGKLLKELELPLTLDE
jgi:hypothetical protein